MAKQTDVDITLGIVDGRVAMSADGEATVRVDTPRVQPLGRNETRATIHVDGDDYRAEIDLDTAELEWLVDELTTALEGDD